MDRRLRRPPTRPTRKTPKKAASLEARLAGRRAFYLRLLWQSFVVMRRKLGNSKATDFSGIGFQDFKLDAGLMANDLAPSRDTASEIENQATHGVDIFIPVIFGQKCAGLLFEIFDAQSGIDIDLIRAMSLKTGPGVPIVFIFNLADNLLDQILDRHQSIDTPELVNDQRHVKAPYPHLKEKLQNRHRRCDKSGLRTILVMPVS